MKTIYKHHAEAVRAGPSKGERKVGERKFFRSLKEALAIVFRLKTNQEKLTGAKVKLPKIRTMKEAANIATELEAAIANSHAIAPTKSEATITKTTNPLAGRKLDFKNKELDQTRADRNADKGDQPKAKKNGEPLNPAPFVSTEDASKWSLKKLVEAIELEGDTSKRFELYKEYKTRRAEPGRLVRKMSEEKSPTKQRDLYRQYQLALARLK